MVPDSGGILLLPYSLASLTTLVNRRAYCTPSTGPLTKEPDVINMSLVVRFSAANSQNLFNKAYNQGVVSLSPGGGNNAVARS
jgi:hypothetical protein